jgi:hypothetical protein
MSVLVDLGGISSLDPQYQIDNLYPSGPPAVLTMVCFVKDLLENVVGSANQFVYLTTLEHESVPNRLIGTGGGGSGAAQAWGAVGRSTGGTTGYGIPTDDKGIFTSYVQLAVEWTRATGNVKIRYHDVIGNELFPEVTGNLLLLGGQAQFYKDFNLFQDNAFQAKGFDGTRLGNLAYFAGALTDAELVEIAQDKNITDAKYTTGGRVLDHYWSFIDDWGVGDIIDQGSTNPVNLTVPYPDGWVYSDINPTSPIADEGVIINAFGNTVLVASTLAGTIYCIRQTAGSTAPTTPAEVINATVSGDILEIATAPANISNTTGEQLVFTTGDSFTEYDYYYALDGASDVLGASSVTATTCGFIQNTELLQDIDGVVFPDNQVRWAWFDGVEPDSFTAPSDTGFDFTSGGQYSFSLPNSALNQGEEGTLILDYKAGGVGGKRSELKYVMQVQ